VSMVRTWHRRGSMLEPTMAVGALVLALLTGFLVASQGVIGFAAVLALGFGLVVYRWPFLGLLLFAGTLAIEKLLVVEGAGGAASGSRYLGTIVFAAWMAGKLLRRESVAPLLKSPLSVTAALFFAFALTSTLWAYWPNIAQRGALVLVMFIALGILTFDLVRSWERLDRVIKALVLGATAAALITIEQAVVGGARRAGGDVAGGVNATSMILVTMLPFAFYLLRSQTSLWWRILGITYIAVGLTATVVTYSRMNLLVLPIILPLLAFHTFAGRRGRIPILAAAVTATVVGLYAIPTERLQDRLATIVPYIQETLGSETGIVQASERGFHLQVGFAIARDHPLIGAGFRNYGPLFRDEYQFFVPGAGYVWRSPRSPHSAHVGILANLGIIGLGTWLALLFGAGLIPAIRAWRRMARRRDLNPHLASQAIAYAVGLQIFVYGWYDDIEVTKLLWILLGLAGAAMTLASADPRPSAGDPRGPAHSGPARRGPGLSRGVPWPADRLQ
jgi:hypothetical protein